MADDDEVTSGLVVIDFLEGRLNAIPNGVRLHSEAGTVSRILLHAGLPAFHFGVGIGKRKPAEKKNLRRSLRKYSCGRQ